jgi:hypothetical protein
LTARMRVACNDEFFRKRVTCEERPLKTGNDFIEPGSIGLMLKVETHEP